MSATTKTPAKTKKMVRIFTSESDGKVYHAVKVTLLTWADTTDGYTPGEGFDIKIETGYDAKLKDREGCLSFTGANLSMVGLEEFAVAVCGLIERGLWEKVMEMARDIKTA